MSPQVTIILESSFNILYLVVVWTLVVLMTRNMSRVAAKDLPVARLIRIAFILLATGDTGHVGFRVVAYLLGGLETQVNVFGSMMSLAGLGGLSTSFTVTFFYMIMVLVWQKRFQKPDNVFTGFLLAVGLVRLLFLALPGNDWGAVVPPQPMSLVRNIPLMAQGVGVIFLFLKSGYRTGDRTFISIGWMIFLSYAFYLPVILFVQQIPLLGMLMIPKTCAYLVVAWLAYKDLWKTKGKENPALAQAG